MQKEEDNLKGVLRPCQCENGGQCFRGMHKAGEACDRTVFLTKASRHRICKGCRSEKKKKGAASTGAGNEGKSAKRAETQAAKTILQQHTQRGQSVGFKRPIVLSLEPPEDAMWGQGGPDSLVGLGTSPRLTPHGVFTPGSGMASFQPMLSREDSTGSMSARGGESFPLGSSGMDMNNLPGDVVVPGMAPVNYGQVEMSDDNMSEKVRKQPRRRISGSGSKGDDYYYDEEGSTQAKRFKAEYSESRAMSSHLTTRSGDQVQLLPCVCTKGGFCHRPQHGIGKPCDSVCRISKNVRHRVCKACRSVGKRDARGRPIYNVRKVPAYMEADAGTREELYQQLQEENARYQSLQHEATQTLGMLTNATVEMTPRTHEKVKHEVLKADEDGEAEALAIVEERPIPIQTKDGQVLMKRQVECPEGVEGRDYTDADERDLLSEVQHGPMAVGAKASSENSSVDDDSGSTGTNGTGSRTKTSMDDALLLLPGGR